MNHDMFIRYVFSVFVGVSACKWSCVESLKMDKPDFKERVVQLYTLVKQFLKLKRPPLAFTVLHTVLLKAQKGEINIDQNFLYMS